MDIDDGDAEMEACLRNAVLYQPQLILTPSQDTINDNPATTAGGHSLDSLSNKLLSLSVTCHTPVNHSAERIPSRLLEAT
jgi:hypothetical protein